MRLIGLQHDHPEICVGVAGRQDQNKRMICSRPRLRAQESSQAVINLVYVGQLGGHRRAGNIQNAAGYHAPDLSGAVDVHRLQTALPSHACDPLLSRVGPRVERRGSDI